jgi:hypothetical protein
MLFAPEDVHYKGYRIVWDARPVPGARGWTGKAAVVLPLTTEAADRVYRVGEYGGFSGEVDAREYLLQAAKNWVDHREDT